MKNTKNIVCSETMKLFTMLVSYFFLILMTFTICKLFHINHCLSFIQIISVTIPIIIYLIFSYDKKIKEKVLIVTLYLMILLVLPFIFGKTYDLSIDGNSYHKTAIAFIRNGWNPIYESSEEFQQQNDSIIEYNPDTKIGIWIDHYPKATWIIAATMYEMTGNIESGKSINLIFSIMLFILSYNILLKIFKKKFISIFISILLTLNPIMISQFFTYYVDGLMGVCFIIEILLLSIINPLENKDKLKWLSLLAICTIFVNIKYTGLLYSGIIAAVYYFYWILKFRKNKDFLTIFKKITLYFTIVFSISIFFVGISSYVKNTINHKNPLYPLIGEDKIDIITTMQPKLFEEKNMLQKIVISIFSKTENVTYYSEAPVFKNPLKVYQEEKEALLIPDVRIGGFGPLFGAISIITIICLIPAFYLFMKNEKTNLKQIILPLLSIIISIILVGESWWARYVPQLYIIPIAVIGLLIYTSKYYKRIIINRILLTISIIYILFNLLTFKYSIDTLITSFRSIENDLIELKNIENLELKLGGSNDLYGYYYNLDDKGINYEIVDEIKEDEIRYVYSWRLQIRDKVIK